MMKTRILFAALGFSLALSFPAHASEPPQKGSGHYEWREVPHSGPRASGPTRTRVWVADNAEGANWGCAMMKEHAGDCMKDIHGADGTSRG